MVLSFFNQAQLHSVRDAKEKMDGSVYGVGDFF
jgi:hypothetical protein